MKAGQVDGIDPRLIYRPREDMRFTDDDDEIELTEEDEAKLREMKAQYEDRMK